MSNVAVTRVGLVLIVVISCFAMACHDRSGDADEACRGRSVRAGVAASLRDVALSLNQELLAREEPIVVETIFGASNTHARQLALGAPLDLLVSADAEIVDELIKKGLLVGPSAVPIARGRLALVARAEAFPSDAGLAALESPELKRLAIAAPSVPLGRYAHAWLEQKGMLEALVGKIMITEHARATLAAVEAGHVDLAIVYESDARLARHAVLLAAIPASEYPPIRYAAARTTAAPACASIGSVLAAWTSAGTQQRLTALGFLPADTRADF